MSGDIPPHPAFGKPARLNAGDVLHVRGEYNLAPEHLQLQLPLSICVSITRLDCMVPTTDLMS
jgi:hypothetical protein